MEDHKVVDSKFRLVILASKRAKQLLRGGKKRIDMNAENPLTIALEEVKQGKVDYEIILSENGNAIENGEGPVEGEMETADESLPESGPEETNSGETEEESESGDEDDAEVVAQVKDSQSD